MESWICLALIIVVFRWGLILIIRSSLPEVIWRNLGHDLSNYPFFTSMYNAEQKRWPFWSMYFDLRKWMFSQFYPTLGK